MDGVPGAQHVPLASIYVPISFPRRSITLVELGNPLRFIPPFTPRLLVALFFSFLHVTCFPVIVCLY